jgi:hypothetical protein
MGEIDYGDEDEEAGLTLVHFSAQPEPVWSHLPVSFCLIDSHAPNVSHKSAYVEPRSG